MPGKYSHLKTTLPAAPTDPSFQTKVNEERSKIKFANIADLGHQFNEVVLKKEKIEDQLKAVNVEEEAFIQALVAELESHGLESFKLPDGTFLGLKDTPYCSVENKADWLTYIRENGMEDLLSVNYQTMSGMVNVMLVEGKRIPPGIKAFMKTSINRRKPQTR